VQVRPNTDARAELPTARGRFEADNPLLPRNTPATIGKTLPIKAADDDVRGGMSSTPQPLDTFSAPPPATDASVADPNDAVADDNSNPGAPTTAPDASPRPDTAPPKTSLQRLLIAIFGALAFAGVTASLMHRFAFIWRKRRARLRRRTMWQSAKKVRARAPQAASAESASAQSATAPSTTVQTTTTSAQTTTAHSTTAHSTTAQAASPQATSPQGVAANHPNPARAEGRNQQDDDAQGQIEELLGTIAKRAKPATPAAALAKLANSQAPAAAPGQRLSARRGVRA
jgi:hypothetical protein